MRAITMAAVGVSALALAGCMPKVSYEGHEVSELGPTPLRALTALDCPEQEGRLVRTAQAADGLSCAYQGRGETVTLRLVALDGRRAADALEPTRAELRALVPLKLAPITPLERDEVGDRADVDLPFFHVHTVGERADVSILGVRIHADGDDAEVHAGGARKHTIVRAGPQGAEIITEDLGRANAEMVYVLAAERPVRAGYSAVGYVAKGPAKGPLVVAEFRATEGHDGDVHAGHGRHGHHVHRGDDGDLSRLIDRNLEG